MKKTTCCTLRFTSLTKYYSGNKIKYIEIGGTCSMYGQLRDSVGVPEKKRPLESPWCGWKINFKMELPRNNLGPGLI
jgi:hypothetical protein